MYSFKSSYARTCPQLLKEKRNKKGLLMNQTVRSQSGKCIQRRPLKRDREEKAVRKPRDGLIVVLELISRRILRQKDCVVTSRTDRATVTRGKTTENTQFITQGAESKRHIKKRN